MLVSKRVDDVFGVGFCKYPDRFLGVELFPIVAIEIDSIVER